MVSYCKSLEQFNPRIKRFNLYESDGKKGVLHKVAISVSAGMSVLYVEGFDSINGEQRSGDHHIYNSGVLQLQDGIEAKVISALYSKDRDCFDTEEELAQYYRKTMELEGDIYQAKKDVLLVPRYEGNFQHIEVLSVEEIPVGYLIKDISSSWKSVDWTNFATARKPRPLLGQAKPADN